MPKYYVKSGELEEVVSTSTPLIAAFEAFCRAKKDTVLDPYYFYIDEIGFRDKDSCGEDCVELPIDELLSGYMYDEEQ